MKKAIPNSYKRSLEQTFYDPESPFSALSQTSEIFYSPLHSVGLLTRGAFYVSDYVAKKYLFLDNMGTAFFGYKPSYIKDAGPLYYTGLWDKWDFQIFNTEIFPRVLQKIKHLPPEEQKNFITTVGYRFKDAKGDKHSLIQRSSIFTNKFGLPVLAMGVVSLSSQPINQHKIAYTLEQITEPFSPSIIIDQKTFFPDGKQGLITTRELEILKHVLDGLSSKQIADKLYLSLFTVNTHRKRMIEKTGCNNTPELLKYAICNHLI